MKKQFTDQEKRFKIYIYIKGVVPRVHEELSHQTLTKDLKRYLSKEDVGNTNKHMKGWLASLVIKEMQTRPQ